MRVFFRLRTPLKLAVTVGMLAVLPAVFAQAAAGSFPWSDLNVPVAGHRYVYTGIARNSNVGNVLGPVERVVEYTSVDRADGVLNFEVSDRIVGIDDPSRIFFDITERRSFSSAGEVLLVRSTSIPDGFSGDPDAPRSVPFSSGLIAPPVYVVGQTYIYQGIFVETSLGGNERRQVTVGPEETVTVPAGTFRCVIINVSLEYSGNMFLRPWGIRSWHAPGVGVVKAIVSQQWRQLVYDVELRSTNFPIASAGGAPLITADPEAVLVGAGDSIRLRVIAEGANLRYAWSHNGVILPGETQPLLVLPNATPNRDGIYRAIVSNADGSVESKAASVKVFPRAGDQPGKLVNLSVRAYARTGAQQLIAGMSLQGNTAPHRILVRGAGPALGSFVSGPAHDPSLTVRDGAGTIVGTNDDWGQGADAAELARAASSVGAFPFQPGSADAALVLPFSAGNFTAAVADELGGMALVEYYNMDSDLAGGFMNLSARGDTRQSSLIVGWAVDGTRPVKLLVRAVGPSLAQFGVTDFAPSPALRVVSANGEATNQRWSNSAQLAELRAAMRAAGAFDLLENSTDAALIATVSGGTFTAVIDQTATGGIALIEIYRLE
jgi:hypothetical protein